MARIDAGNGYRFVGKTVDAEPCRSNYYPFENNKNKFMEE